MFRTILTAGLVAAATLPTHAQWPAPVERALTREYNLCMDNGPAGQGQTGAMMECAGAEYDRQDARLNQAYRMTMQRLPAARRAALRNEERAWIARRDRTCRAAARSFGGGTGAGLEFQQCQLRETIARRLVLERYR